MLEITCHQTSEHDDLDLHCRGLTFMERMPQLQEGETGLAILLLEILQRTQAVPGRQR